VANIVEPDRPLSRSWTIPYCA